MAIKRTVAENEAVFQIGMNIILKGSKKMSDEKQDELVTVGKVRIIVVDASIEVIVKPGGDGTPPLVLVDETVDATAFATGSVGYKLHQSNAKFKEAI